MNGLKKHAFSAEYSNYTRRPPLTVLLPDALQNLLQAGPEFVVLGGGAVGPGPQLPAVRQLRLQLRQPL